MSANEAYITGMGISEVGICLERSPLGLTIDAVQAALDNAGLTRDQIDGVATYPGKVPAYLGFSPVGSDELIEAMGLRTTWHLGGGEMTAQLGAIATAAMAVKAGAARHVICFRTVYEAGAMAKPDEYPMPKRDRVSGLSQWTAPFNAISAATWTALYANRHMHKYGLTKEQLGHIVINDHANASRNPSALVNKPLSMDDYLSPRPISSPFGLYDCARFSDACTVVIVSAGDAIDEVHGTPLRIAATAGSVDRYSWDQPDLASAYPTGRDLWKNTDYRPKDVDTVQLYDGFSFLPITWLEGLGFCEVGEGGEFLDGGRRIALDGELPMNTGGGQLGWGRLHGFGFAYEAVLQLRGEGDQRQIPGDPRVAVATSGGGPMAAALLLTKD